MESSELLRNWRNRVKILPAGLFLRDAEEKATGYQGDPGYRLCC